MLLFAIELVVIVSVFASVAHNHHVPAVLLAVLAWTVFLVSQWMVD